MKYIKQILKVINEKKHPDAFILFVLERCIYDAGFDCGKNGANTDNCHFGYFNTPERTKEWELGNKDASQ